MSEREMTEKGMREEGVGEGKVSEKEVGEEGVRSGFAAEHAQEARLHPPLTKSCSSGVQILVR